MCCNTFSMMRNTHRDTRPNKDNMRNGNKFLDFTMDWAMRRRHNGAANMKFLKVAFSAIELNHWGNKFLKRLNEVLVGCVVNDTNCTDLATVMGHFG